MITHTHATLSLECRENSWHLNRAATPVASLAWLWEACERKHAYYANPRGAQSAGCRSVHQRSLQKHDHLVEIQHLHFQVLGAECRTFVWAVDISPFQRKTTRMQFAAHVLRRGGMELEFSQHNQTGAQRKVKDGRSPGRQNAHEHHLQLSALLWTTALASWTPRRALGGNNVLQSLGTKTVPSSCHCQVSPRLLCFINPQHSSAKPSVLFTFAS